MDWLETHLTSILLTMIFSLIAYGVLSTVNNLTKAIDLLRLELKIVNEIVVKHISDHTIHWSNKA